jgi:hypothetical protein
MIGFAQSIITIVLFIGILGILVVIHELGHFVTARLAAYRSSAPSTRRSSISATLVPSAVSITTLTLALGDSIICASRTRSSSRTGCRTATRRGLASSRAGSPELERLSRPSMRIICTQNCSCSNSPRP